MILPHCRKHPPQVGHMPGQTTHNAKESRLARLAGAPALCRPQNGIKCIKTHIYVQREHQQQTPTIQLANSPSHDMVKVLKLSPGMHPQMGAASMGPPGVHTPVELVTFKQGLP